MHAIREAIRLLLNFDLSNRDIARSTKISHTTIGRYKSALKNHDPLLTWDAVQTLSDEVLDQILFPPKQILSSSQREEPNWVNVQLEMARTGVTLFLLWDEYKQSIPTGMSYATFARKYRKFINKAKRSYRKPKKYGYAIYVDYSGKRFRVQDILTGETYKAEVFFGSAGGSDLCFAEASYSQSIQDWIPSHVRMLEFFGAIPQILVCDNLKSAVTKPDPYEPVFTRAYQDFANHYDIAIIPARVKRPQDKAGVENGIKIFQRWVMAALRNHVFHSLEELNTKLKFMMEKYNNKKFQKFDSTRRLEFENFERPLMRTLPDVGYEPKQFLINKLVGPDYHIEVDKHFYSIPHQYVSSRVDVQITQNLVEFFHQMKRIASHARSYQARGQSTQIKHMPFNHQLYANQSPEQFLSWATTIGESTLAVFKFHLEQTHPAKGLTVCFGIKKLEKDYGAQRLEAACKRALIINSPSRTSINSILKTKLDQQPIETKNEITPVNHSNIRGADYYAQSSRKLNNGDLQ